MSDKNTTCEVERFALKTHHFLTRLNSVLANSGGEPADLKRSAAALRGLWLETTGLTNGAYKPSFQSQR